MGVKGLARLYRKGLEGLETRYNERRLKLRSYYDHPFILTRADHAHPLYQGGQSGDAGVGNHNRRCLYTQSPGYITGTVSQGNVILAKMLDVSLDGRQHETGGKVGGLNSGVFHSHAGCLQRNQLEIRLTGPLTG